MMKKVGEDSDVDMGVGKEMTTGEAELSETLFYRRM